MHELSRTSPNYRNLAAEGVTVKALEPMDYMKRSWRMKCCKPQNMPKEAARIAIMNFVRNEWEGTDMQWFRDRLDPDKTIVVVFNTNAL